MSESLQQRTDYLDRTLNRLIYWVRLAEIRIPPIIAIDTTLLGLLVTRLPLVTDWHPLHVIFVSLSCLLLSSSLFMLALASFPRLIKGTDDAVLWFGGIATPSPDIFKNRMKKMTPKAFYQDLADQCYNNAIILKRKYRWIRYSLFSLFLGLLPWMLSMYFLYQPNP